MLHAMVIASAPARQLGATANPRLRFGEDGDGGHGPRRPLLFLDDRPAFELSFWCGTCQFLFQREPGANQTLSLTELESRLADGADGLDGETIDAFAALLPAGE